VTFKLERPPKDPVTLQIEDPQGLFVATLPMQSTGSGAFTGLDLVRGSYTARAFANDRELVKLDFVVRDTPLRVVLTPP
jgi:hypothetical protein